MKSLERPQSDLFDSITVQKLIKTLKLLKTLENAKIVEINNNMRHFQIVLCKLFLLKIFVIQKLTSVKQETL